MNSREHGYESVVGGSIGTTGQPVVSEFCCLCRDISLSRRMCEFSERPCIDSPITTSKKPLVLPMSALGSLRASSLKTEPKR